MRYQKISRELFINNRFKFNQKTSDNSLTVFNSNDQMPTNADGTMPFKQNSDLFWMTGINQEDTTLIIAKINGEIFEKLYIKETNEHISIWEGEKLTKQRAKQISGIDSVHWNECFLKDFKNLCNQINSIYLNKNIHTRSKNNVETRDDRFRKKIKSNFSNKEILEAAPIVNDLRRIKSNEEIKLLKIACNITEEAFRRVLKFVKPGVMEYEIEAEIAHTFISNCSKGFAYEPIIGSGFSSCILHYIENNKICNDGDILLMDFGAEYANYCADLSRTIPVNGKYTKRQKDVYNSVLHVFNCAKSMLVPGTFIEDYHKEVGKIMQNELIKLKLIDSHDVKKQDAKNPIYKKYFMHGTSHFLGLDVHDVGNVKLPIENGMVFTCEPGIYIREESLGVRIENDILVSDSEPIDLMGEIPVEANHIEEIMNS